MKVYQLALPKREEGDWYVRTKDFGRLPVGHHDCMDRPMTRYFDPSDGRPSARWKKWIKDVQAANYMVIQISKKDFRTGRVRCVGYVGLFKVSEAELSKAGVFSANIEQIGVVEYETK